MICYIRGLATTRLVQRASQTRQWSARHRLQKSIAVHKPRREKATIISPAARCSLEMYTRGFANHDKSRLPQINKTRKQRVATTLLQHGTVKK